MQAKKTFSFLVIVDSSCSCYKEIVQRKLIILHGYPYSIYKIINSCSCMKINSIKYASTIIPWFFYLLPAFAPSIQLFFLLNWKLFLIKTAKNFSYKSLEKWIGYGKNFFLFIRSSCYKSFRTFLFGLV